MHDFSIMPMRCTASTLELPPRVSAAVHAQDAAHEMVANDLASQADDEGWQISLVDKTFQGPQRGWIHPLIYRRGKFKTQAAFNPHDLFLAPALVAAPNAVVKASVLSKGSDLRGLMTLRMVGKAKKQTSRWGACRGCFWCNQHH